MTTIRIEEPKSQTYEPLLLTLGDGRNRHLPAADRRKLTERVQLTLGHVIAESDIDTLGTLPPFPAGVRLDAFPISAGTRSGPARIVLSPQAAGDLGQGYVLVCPSTDPSWTPLFVNAAALVVECGGTLSHGAVVARELGIPAVVYAGATKLLQDGEQVAVDGQHGTILRGGSETASASPQDEPGANDTRISRDLVPPIPGWRERGSARLRNAMLPNVHIYR
jgi:pyruvate,water dikinase